MILLMLLQKNNTNCTNDFKIILVNYKLSPIPMASVATITLQLLLGSLNFAACANFVPGGRPPYITATSFPLKY